MRTIILLTLCLALTGCWASDKELQAVNQRVDDLEDGQGRLANVGLKQDERLDRLEMEVGIESSDDTSDDTSGQPARLAERRPPGTSAPTTVRRPSTARDEERPSQSARHDSSRQPPPPPADEEDDDSAGVTDDRTTHSSTDEDIAANGRRRSHTIIDPFAKWETLRTFRDETNTRIDKLEKNDRKFQQDLDELRARLNGQEAPNEPAPTKTASLPSSAASVPALQTSHVDAEPSALREWLESQVSAASSLTLNNHWQVVRFSGSLAQSKAIRQPGTRHQVVRYQPKSDGPAFSVRVWFVGAERRLYYLPQLISITP